LPRWKCCAGPQGSLFGRNTTAGIVKFDTAQPTATWQGQGSASWGSRNSVNVDAGVGGPLTADGRISSALGPVPAPRQLDQQHLHRRQRRRHQARQERWAASTSATCACSCSPSRPKPVAALSGHYRDYDGSASIFYRGSIQKGTHTVPENLDLTNVAYDEGGNNPQAYKTKGVSLKAVQELGGVTLTSITAYEASHYSRGDTDGGAAANFGGAGYGEQACCAR
jgi:iron complex outermembrane receptor protein